MTQRQARADEGEFADAQEQVLAAYLSEQYFAKEGWRYLSFERTIG
jgi:hypothetical protein